MEQFFAFLRSEMSQFIGTVPVEGHAHLCDHGGHQTTTGVTHHVGTWGATLLLQTRSCFYQNTPVGGKIWPETMLPIKIMRWGLMHEGDDVIGGFYRRSVELRQ